MNENIINITIQRSEWVCATCGETLDGSMTRTAGAIVGIPLDCPARMKCAGLALKLMTSMFRPVEGDA